MTPPHMFALHDLLDGHVFQRSPPPPACTCVQTGSDCDGSFMDWDGDTSDDNSGDEYSGDEVRCLM